MFFIVSVILAGLFAILVLLAFRKPSNDRNWSKDQAVLPSVIINDNGNIIVKNVRKARYNTVSDYIVCHKSLEFNVTELKKAWLVISPFGNFSFFGLKPAHVFISFQLEDGSFLSVSPEIRKKRMDKFSPVRGAFRNYEIMYVVADEEDVIKLRTNYRKDTVMLYPLALSSATVQKLFIDISKKINSLYKNAEFYNTVAHSCTTNISEHMRRAGVNLPKYSLLYLFPKTIDSIFYKAGLIDTDLPLRNARTSFDITLAGERCGSAENFSECIRKEMPKV